ncbi:MAG: CDP-glycerol glycerophosphotransferase family protein, partial [Oscillospiraceae bacterium]|nr:CDP-glycerol glycerophosphotransferase family protein [Oscillospiraceae bacterium]
LGSPKFDKAINSKREDFTFPENWKRMSAGKKVVLYNTSVGALLSGDDKYLLKLKAVFEMFRNRDDVVLLWRPHPLSVTTYTTMRPQLLRDYEALVADYTQAGYGIYDDSPDMYCAIAASDAYFGDWSSLVALYGILGKPIMIQNAELYPENPAAKEISCDNRFDDGESFWFTAPYCNALYKADAVTREISYIGSFPGEKNFGTRLYGTISKSNEKLYFAPIGASDAGVYNIESGEFEQITEDERFNVSTEPFAEGEKGTAILTDAAYDAMKPLRERMFRENPEDFQTIYDCCITEGRIRRAGDFLDLLGDSEAVSRLGTRQREIFKGITNFPDGNSGAAIYEYCKRTAL